jgi:Zn-dependent membrane protease YugP
MWLLVLGPMLLGLWAQFKVNGNYNRFSRVRTARGLTGADVAAAVLRAANITDVRIREIGGHLTDHYDPANKVLALSSEVYRTPSVAAAGIAAHEAGHAIQHARAYAPLQARMALVPITNFASGASMLLILGGFFLAGSFLGKTMLMFGIGALCILAVFQIVTLPVEFDASKRAKTILVQMGLVEGEEARGVDKVLDSAALTYVAAMVATLGNILYYLMLLSGTRSQD